MLEQAWRCRYPVLVVVAVAAAPLPPAEQPEDFGWSGKRAGEQLQVAGLVGLVVVELVELDVVAGPADLVGSAGLSVQLHHAELAD